MKLVMSRSLIYQYGAIIIVNLSMTSTGLSIVWPSPMLIKLRNETETPLLRPITDEEGSWMVSLGYLLTIISNITIGYLMDCIGRKTCLLLASLPRLSMALVCILTDQVWVLLIARTIAIMSDCVYFVIVPVYASEIASKEQRGVLGTFLQIFTCLGAVITLSIGPFLSYKTFNIIFTVIIGVTSISIIALPESPYFLYANGRTAEAFKLLAVLRTEEQTKEEINEYKAALAITEEETKIQLLINNKILHKSLPLGILMAIGIQIIGYNAVTFYLQTILASTHTEIGPEVASVVISLMEFCAGCLTTLTSHRFFRKTILTWSLCGYITGMVGIGTFFSLTKDNGYPVTGFLNYLPMISLIFIIFSYSAGIGNLVWLILGEIFDGSTRAIGVSISLVLCNVTIFLTTKYFYSMTIVLGPAGTFWFYGCTALLLNVIINIFLPETKDKSFSEIQKALKGK